MDKKEIENILISMKTPGNTKIIDKLLDKIKIIDDDSFQNAIMQAGGTREAITEYFKNKISERQNNVTQRHTPINKMFSYGIAGNCVHLHLPGELHSMLEKYGISRTIDTVNMYLLDAIDKIKELKDNRYDEFQGKDSIYMISPILLGRELRFLKELDFETRTYKKKELNDKDFLINNPEAEFATQIFGKDKNIGIAQISFDLISSKEWQEKKEEKAKEFSRKGIELMSGKQEISRKISTEDIKGLEKIGEGKCANVYRKNSIVYKILRENSDSRRLYSKKMIQQLVGIKSELCVFPNEILEDDNGNFLGYSMDFVSGRKMKDIIATLPFEQLKLAITKAKQGIAEISEQNIMFDDMHDDNIMWNEETQSIQIIDTDFFKKIEDNSNLNNINCQSFSRTIQYMIDSRIGQYGRTQNEELIPFYDLEILKKKDGKKLSIDEYISNLKSVIENEFGKEFNNLNEIEMALQEKQERIEEEQHLEQIAKNLTIKEKFIRFLAQSRHIRKLPIVNRLINRQIKMLPEDVQKVVKRPRRNTAQNKTEGISNSDERKNFKQELKNWTPVHNKMEEISMKQKNIEEIDVNKSYFHFTETKNLPSIEKYGLKAQVGDASTMVDDKPRVCLSKGGKGILGIKDSFIRKFKETRICDIPEGYKEYFNITDFTSTQLIPPELVYEGLQKRFENETYLIVDAQEGEDFSREDIHGMTSEFDIKGKENHDISADKISKLVTPEGSSGLDVIKYMYNRLLKSNPGKENLIKNMNPEITQMMEYIKEKRQTNDGNERG